MSEDILNVNVNVAGRPYRLQITPDEEDNIRQSAIVIREKIKELRGMYAAKDQQDYLAMAALLLGVDLLEKKQDSGLSELSDFQHKFEQLDSILSTFLEKKGGV